MKRKTGKWMSPEFPYLYFPSPVITMRSLGIEDKEATHLHLIEGTSIQRGLVYNTYKVVFKLIDIKSGNLLAIDIMEGSQL